MSDLGALLRDALQGMSNAAASTVSGPVDLISAGMRKAGMGRVIGDAPVGGSEWMARQGLTRQPVNALAGMAGETAGMILPFASGPRTAAALNALAANAAKPAPALAAQRGAVDLAALDYAGSHRPPLSNGGAPAHDLTGGGNVYPDDVYGPRAAQYYGHFGGGDPMDAQSIALAQSLRGKPDASVTIYRAVPTEHAATGINPGDWVTINRAYAKNHGESTLDGQYKIISKKVRAKDIYTNGDSIHEWGFDPQP